MGAPFSRLKHPHRKNCAPVIQPRRENPETRVKRDERAAVQLVNLLRNNPEMIPTVKKRTDNIAKRALALLEQETPGAR